MRPNRLSAGRMAGFARIMRFSHTASAPGRRQAEGWSLFGQGDYGYRRQQVNGKIRWNVA